MLTHEVTNRDGPRSKRKMILDAAIENFGEVGFEHTKWATISSRVGIGQTALYHYFESKSHCLLTIMRMELDTSLEAFRNATADAPDAETALRAAVASAYQNVSAQDALQRRILQNHMVMLTSPRHSEKEEIERRLSRELVREIEDGWSAVVQRGIDEGSFVKSDPRVTAGLLLALVVSVWRWYRPDGGLSLSEITDVVTDACLRIVRA
ncbi:MAG: TetR/AcrR family transcriptional regulator [Rhodococcus sp. (in: high G+C Gram-positive bacteria)]|uniref:TetR/AcrR family transcriptional regulator n=1 Tax=Rhodococcus sp. TaxID=1831 RepID=UPI003BB16965